MQRHLTHITEIDAWVSMLENWADSVKEFKRECETKGLLVAQCLPKISKNLLRTLAAMKTIWKRLPDQIEGNSMKGDLAMITPSTVVNWYLNVQRKVRFTCCCFFITSYRIYFLCYVHLWTYLGGCSLFQQAISCSIWRSNDSYQANIL